MKTDAVPRLTWEEDDLDFDELTDTVQKAVLLEKKYSPLEIRDSHGRWTRSSKQLNSLPDGSYTPARQALHDQLVAGMLAGGRSSAHPQVTFLGGGPASGKSSVLASHGTGITIAADDIKEKLPEYEPGIPASASFVHEESTNVAHQAQKLARDRQLSYTLDGTGDTSYQRMKEKVSAAHDAGYTVSAKYVTVDVDEAIRRADQRGRETGRYIPHAALRAIHQSVTGIFTKAIAGNLFDTAELWDTNGSKPSLIGSKPADGSWRVQDQEAWRRFLAKGADAHAAGS